MAVVAQDVRPLVSVIMAVFHHHPRYFPAAVQSVFAQTLADLELIIVEAASTRSAWQLLTGLEDRRLRYFRYPHRPSTAGQFNWGLARARAEFVTIFDADDLCHPDRFKHQVAYLRAHPDVGVVGSQTAVIDGSNRFLSHYFYPLVHDQILRTFPVTTPISQGSAMHRKALLKPPSWTT